MTTLLLLLLLQDRPVDASIEAFLKGDKAARAELLKLGAFAIRSLQKARDRGPEKIDAIVFELKKAAAFPKDSLIPGKLKEVTSLSIKDVGFGPDFIQVLLNAGAAVYLDELKDGDLKATKFSVEKAAAALDAINQMCRQTGLDYGFFHNYVVIGSPDRLWPSGPPTKPPPLKGDESAKAKALVEKLGDESIEVRESATKDLLAFGPSVIAVLEANLNRKEGELAARCAAVIDRLTPRPRGAFGPPGAERQKRTEAEDKVFKQLQTMKVSLAFEKTPISDVASRVGEFAGLPLEIQGAAGEVPVTIQVRDQKLIDFLCLVTQSRDLDFMIRDRKIVVDTREVIEKSVKGEK